MLEFQQSESIAERRRWILVLVDSTDGVTGKTGQTGTVFISKNGGAGAASTNSIVEVDAGDMPGHYYIELTAAELDTLGHISISYKAANTLAFHDRAIVSYNNPYQSVGGFSGGGEGKGLTRAQLDELLKKFIKAMKEEMGKLKFPEIPAFPEIPDYAETLAQISKKETDLSPVLDAILSIERPKDYAQDFKSLVEQLKEMSLGITSIDFPTFAKSVDEFQSKMAIATEDINGSLEEVDKIKSNLSELDEQMKKFQETLAEQGDMDKRFDAMGQAANNKTLQALTEKMTTLAEEIIHLRFDIKESNLK